MHFESKKASSTQFSNLKSAHFFWAFLVILSVWLNQKLFSDGKMGKLRYICTVGKIANINNFSFRFYIKTEQMAKKP